jgi:hypothetical protein
MRGYERRDTLTDQVVAPVNNCRASVSDASRYAHEPAHADATDA